jgi:hypothetical protein
VLTLLTLPIKPHADWPGMSGSAVLAQDGPNQREIWVYGLVQAVPVNFGGQLNVARLAEVWQGPNSIFRTRLVAAGVPDKDAEDPSAIVRDLAGVWRPIPVTHRLKIEKFIEYYVGTKDRPVPFGGRQKELEELSGWLSEQTSPPHLLVAAPAGRGKTALLVNWLRLIPSSWNVAFVPISIRFQTNHASIFYGALAHQFAHIAGATVGVAQQDAAEFYRDRCLELLNEINEKGISTVVIVDGLDEIAGWEIDWTLFQSKPGSTTRIIVSARILAGDSDGPSGWLHRLDWLPSHQLAVVSKNVLQSVGHKVPP